MTQNTRCLDSKRLDETILFIVFLWNVLYIDTQHRSKADNTNILSEDNVATFCFENTSD